jgi:hypothetical protein
MPRRKKVHIREELPKCYECEGPVVNGKGKLPVRLHRAHVTRVFCGSECVDAYLDRVDLSTEKD